MTFGDCRIPSKGRTFDAALFAIPNPASIMLHYSSATPAVFQDAQRFEITGFELFREIIRACKMSILVCPASYL
jgi:hypothetical protein